MDRVDAAGALVRVAGDVAALHPAGLLDGWWQAVDAASADVLAGRPLPDVVAGLLSLFGDPATGVRLEPLLPADRTVAPAEGAIPERPAVRTVAGVAVLDGPVAAAVDSTHDLPDLLDRTVAALPADQPLVVDLRGAGPHLVTGLAQRLARLLPEGLVLPGVRATTYPALGEERGWLQTGDQRLPGGGTYVGPLAAVVDVESTGLRLALALRAACGAIVVQHGALRPSPVVPLRIPLGDERVARVRTADAVLAGAVVDPCPDVVVAAADDPVVVAADALQGRARPTPSVPAVTVTTARPDDDRWSRLARLDAAIRLRFAYPHLLDEPWEQVVADTRTELARCGGADAELALGHAVRRLCDGHAMLYAPAVLERVGLQRPDVRLVDIDGELVVAAVGPGVSGIAPGDAIVTVDGASVAERIAAIAPYLSASTPQGLSWRYRGSLLSGAAGTDAVLGVVDVDGRDRSVTLIRNLAAPPRPTAALPVWCVPRSDVGYVDLGRLAPREVAAAFDAVAGTDAVVFDLRGYPRSTGALVAGRLARRSTVGARLRRPVPTAPYDDPAPWGHHTTTDVHIDQLVHPIAPHYGGRVVAIIDEGTISQGEHTALFLATAGDAIFVGGPTNGTNGNVATVELGRGAYALYTGVEVTHADGSQLQRVGVQPTVAAAPTRAGLAAGRDEVLEVALSVAAEA